MTDLPAACATLAAAHPDLSSAQLLATPQGQRLVGAHGADAVWDALVQAVTDRRLRAMDARVRRRTR